MEYIAFKTQDAQNRQFQRLVFAQNRRFLPQPKARNRTSTIPFTTHCQYAVVPGEAFGEEGQGFVRLSYAGDADELRKGLRRMCDFAERNR